MKFSIEIDDTKVTDLLHGHSGSYSDWLHSAEGKWYNLSGFRVRFDKETDNEGDGTGRMTIKKAAVARGLAIFAKECPVAFSDWMQGNDDDLAFDCIMQCIIFGKLVYG